MIVTKCEDNARILAEIKKHIEEYGPINVELIFGENIDSISGGRGVFQR